MKFIGKKYRDEKEKQIILNSYDDFQREKLIFLNELYDNENTLFAMWRVYDRYIHIYEIHMQEDLKYFDTVQVKNILFMLFNYSDDTTRTIYTFMRTYFEYCIGKAEIFQNPTEIIDIDMYLANNRKAKEDKIYSLDYVYSLVDETKRYSSFSNVIPLLLVRYGVKGNKMSWLVNLKWSDVDFKNKEISIFDRNDGKLITSLPVDDRLLETLDQYRNYLADKNILNDYILTSKNGNQISTIGVHSRNKYLTDDLSKYIDNFKRISTNDLLKSRQIELLLKIRSKRKLSTYDTEMISEVLNGRIEGQYVQRLKRFYKDITDEKVLPILAGEMALIDENSEKFATDIAARLNINLDEIPLIIE